MPRYPLINAIGSIVISAITLTSALYLLVLLHRQGKGKLRVRLLVGMVVSDLLLGVVILPPDAMYLAGRKLVTGSAGCNAQGFILIAILFTQHLWTLAIVISTFLLLRHPLSRVTFLLERYSWVITPVIWGVSILHAGLWYHYIGYTNTGNLCYYGTRSARVGLDRDICQFIPRAFVFLVTIILYSRLFTFLRRPDTIQLSFHSTPKTSIIDVRSAQPARLPIAKLSKKLGITLSAACPQSPKKEVNPEAPWEAMEFIQVGNVDLLAPDATVTCVNDCAAARPPPASHFRALALESGSSSTNTLSAIAPPCKTEDASGTVQLSYDGSALISSSPKIGSSGVDVGVGVEASQTSMTIASAGCTTGFPALVESEKKVVGVKEEGEEPPEEQRQTLKEFFAEHQMSAAELGAVGKNGGGCQQRSATSYFNRQASLLMLYFPFAYMAVFSVSLVRLVYDMAYSGSSNPVLGIISHWMVLSAGVIDGLVYGIAEFMVKRKVRRKMPEHL